MDVKTLLVLDTAAGGFRVKKKAILRTNFGAGAVCCSNFGDYEVVGFYYEFQVHVDLTQNSTGQRSTARKLCRQMTKRFECGRMGYLKRRRTGTDLIIKSVLHRFVPSSTSTGPGIYLGKLLWN